MLDLHTLETIAVIAIVTALLRIFPFIVFSKSTKTPKIVEKLGKLLPFAVMGMLVVYCLKDVNLTSVSSFLPALISCIVVAITYIWKRNTILSIVLGVVCNMVLVQIIF